MWLHILDFACWNIVMLHASLLGLSSLVMKCWRKKKNAWNVFRVANACHIWGLVCFSPTTISLQVQANGNGKGLKCFIKHTLSRMISILQGRLKLDGNFFKQERTCALKGYRQNWRSPDDCEKNAAELYSRTEQRKSLPLRLGFRKVKDSPKQKGKLSSTLLRTIYGVQHPDRVRQGSRKNWVKYCRYSFLLQFSEWRNLDLCFIERYLIF